MPRKFYKHKLLLDEGFLYRQRLPILNSRFNVKHITGDLGYTGLKDEKIYQLGIKQSKCSLDIKIVIARRLKPTKQSL